MECSGRLITIRYQLEKHSSHENYARQFLLRGRMIYQKPEADCVKSCLLIGGYPLSILCYKIAPLFCYLPLKALSKICCDRVVCLSQNISLLEDEFHFDRLPMVGLRASIGLGIHPIISLAGCIMPCYSGECARANGDLERWINGHTEEDVRTKSLGRRMHEVYYVAPCQQPIGIVKEGKISDDDNEIFLEKLEAEGALASFFSLPARQQSMV